MNQDRNTRRPATRNDDPTNTAGLSHERTYSRDEQDKIFAAANAVMRIEPEARKAYGSVHRLMAFARDALVLAGFRAEAAEEAGVLPGTAWAQARDLRALVFSLGASKAQNEQRQA